MISIYNGVTIASVDNKDADHVSITTSQRREIEELVGKDIKLLTTEQIRSQVRFISAD